ncbi:MAG: hypothetical protein AUH11_17175 [Acidobacteria bacterium 13_2_20CM_57_17]|nr:MAG: hypothetical protein AUH11_17175 [Acidobacteria bacterium 13_2_20CM_57_17]OLB91503.1 MAG: hypothetical protein AUI02_09490 [Acidobacteria bacterium 13_2_20CM_2_57_12]OLE16138.1 MAG: hypothetical protein AUG83_04225 [Acidobacteria bacterium 13_1_20CM_4_57_11]
MEFRPRRPSKGSLGTYMNFALALFLMLTSAIPPTFGQTADTAKRSDDTKVETDFLQEKASTAVSVSKTALGFINEQDGAISNTRAFDLLKALLRSPDQAYVKTNFAGLFDAKGTLNETLVEKKACFIINVVVWTPTEATQNTDNPSTSSPTQRWYVFRNGKLAQQKRLLGVHTFYFLYIHLNKGDASYLTRYDFTSTEATPIFLQHLYALASVLTTETQNKAENLQANVWGGRQLTFSYATSDIAITSKITNLATTTPEKEKPAINNGSSSGTSTGNAQTFLGGDYRLVSASDKARPSAMTLDDTPAKKAPPTPKDGSLDSPVTFHNEAGPWLDINIGFPATNVNELSFDSTSTGFTPKTVDKRRLFGLLNFYPFPKQRIQLAERNFSWIPSLIAGLPLASQPLHKPVVAVGWGPPLLQVYIGSIIAKQDKAPAGTTLTKSVCTGWCPQFTFGVTFSVTALKDKLTQKK